MISCRQTDLYFEWVRLVGVCEESIVTFTYMEYQKNLLRFYEVCRKHIHSCVQARLCYVLLYPEAYIAKQRLMEAFSIEFQQTLCNVLWEAWRNPFIAACKVDFIMYQCIRIQDCQTTFNTSLSYRISVK
jgi:hypothetical protein